MTNSQYTMNVKTIRAVSSAVTWSIICGTRAVNRAKSPFEIARSAHGVLRERIEHVRLQSYSSAIAEDRRQVAITSSFATTSSVPCIRM